LIPSSYYCFRWTKVYAYNYSCHLKGLNWVSLIILWTNLIYFVKNMFYILQSISIFKIMLIFFQKKNNYVDINNINIIIAIYILPSSYIIRVREKKSFFFLLNYKQKQLTFMVIIEECIWQIFLTKYSTSCSTSWHAITIMKI
jgi:hypothetical protein